MSSENKVDDGVMLKAFDRILDSYNDKKITKEVMLDKCKSLHKKLSLTFMARNSTIESMKGTIE